MIIKQRSDTWLLYFVSILVPQWKKGSLVQRLFMTSELTIYHIHHVIPRTFDDSKDIPFWGPIHGGYSIGTLLNLSGPSFFTTFFI